MSIVSEPKHISEVNKTIFSKKLCVSDLLKTMTNQ